VCEHAGMAEYRDRPEVDRDFMSNDVQSLWVRKDDVVCVWVADDHSVHVGLRNGQQYTMASGSETSSWDDVLHVLALLERVAPE
jgi:hypothetical protein